MATSAWVPLLCGQPVSHPVSDRMAGLGGFSVGTVRCDLLSMHPGSSFFLTISKYQVFKCSTYNQQLKRIVEEKIASIPRQPPQAAAPAAAARPPPTSRRARRRRPPGRSSP